MPSRVAIRFKTVQKWGILTSSFCTLGAAIPHLFAVKLDALRETFIGGGISFG
jgi:hypothetical protein